MNSVPIISVIVSVYNAETFMHRAVDGLLAQTLSDYEVLIIDDGSTDGTGEVCDDYARKDPRIRVFHEQHQGVTHARQLAIDQARGKYFIRIDADDQIYPEMLEDMYQALEEADADMLICDYKEISNNGLIYRKQKPTALTPTAVANDLLERRLFGALWNKMFKTSCLKDKSIRIHENLDLREDIVFVLDMLPHIENIVYMPQAYYLYDKGMNANSLSNTYLTENRHYYDQEVLWLKAALDCPLINIGIRKRFIGSLLNYAYVTLSGKFYSAEEWMTMFTPCINLFKEVENTYKRKIVMWALDGHYKTASLIRSCIARIRKTT